MSQRVPEPSRPISAADLHEQPLQRGFPKWDWRSLPFVLMHVSAVVLPFFTTFSWKLVALAIGISVRTVEGHLYQVFTKLGVSSRSDLLGLI